MPDQLVALPHSGLRVPHTDLHVTAARTMPGTDGDMLNATLRQGSRIIGHLINEGRGGPTFFQPCTPGFGWRELAAFVAACRNPADEPVTEETVLDLLAEEYRTTRDIAAAARDGHVALRQCVLHDGLTYRTGSGRSRPLTTPAVRAKLCAELEHSQPCSDGEWWQHWTGTAWDNLTQPATPDH